MKSTYHLYIAKAAFIDPTDCGSVVAFEVHKRSNSRLTGTIDLSDCNRKIQWYFNPETGTTKIDEVIALLQEFRAVWVRAVKENPTKERKRSANVL